MAAACFAAALSAQAPRRAPDVRYEPSPPAVVDRMLALADLHKGDVIYDLGCGDGRVVIEAAKRFGVRGVGIDIDPKLVALARRNARRAGVQKLVEFREEDLFEADISPASVVTLFLFPDVNMRLRPKLWRDLKPGTRVISHCHDMGDWKPERQADVGEHTVYYWTIGNAPPGQEKR